MHVQISVIIVNWNAGSQLASCVASIAQHHFGLVSSVIIVDNASTDESLIQVEALEGLPFQLLVVRNYGNHGFGSACNQGAALATSEYLLFLNPDTRLFDGSLSGVLEYLKHSDSQDVGIVGIQLFDENNKVSRSCARFPSAIGFLAHAIGLDRIFPRLGHFMAEWSHDTEREVDHVIGAFYFVRRKVFDSLNGFDERFFVYLEDLDFSYRAKQKGWRSMFLGDVQAFHAGGGTSNQVKARRLFYSLRSRLLYSFKHFSFIGAMTVLLVTLLLEPLSRSALALGRRSFTTFQETWSGYGMLWRWLPQWIFKGVTR
jgi:GT2 family glycosyltransferase